MLANGKEFRYFLSLTQKITGTKLSEIWVGDLGSGIRKKLIPDPVVGIYFYARFL
jgi:hypothetical protein